MALEPHKTSRPQRSVIKKVRRLLLLQGILALLLSGITLGWAGYNAACSFLVGAGIYLGPSWVFAKILFRYFGAQRAKNILQALYMAEAYKIILSALFFAGAFILLPVSPLPLFMGFIILQLSFVGAPWFLK